jgi:uncharacterized protein YbjT (DUF2867 family)
VLGGTGAVGSALVRELLASPVWSPVLILVRRPTEAFAGDPGAHKLLVRMIDMANLEWDTRSALADVAWAESDLPASGFCTLGVGQPRKVPRAEFRRVDVDYPAAFARACKDAGVAHMSLLSAVGANAASRSYYLRVKGEAEAAVSAPGFPRVSLFRPSQLMTRQIRYGLQDHIAQRLFPRISRFLPSRYREVHVEELARAMRINAEQVSEDPVQVLYRADFAALVATDATADG